MRIIDILHEERFDSVVYYFESNGFSFISDLLNFEFDLLYFVPGLDENIVAEATELCKTALTSPVTSISPEETITGEVSDIEGDELVPCVCDDAEVEKLNVTIENIVISLKIAEGLFSNEAEIQKHTKDVLALADCDNKDVFLIICEELCEKVASAGFTEEEIRIMKSMQIEDVFADVMMANRRCGGALINHCFGIGKKTMWDMRDFEFDPSCVRGASEASMRACKGAYEQFIRDLKAGKYHKEEPTQADHILAFIDKWHSLNENMRKCAVNGGRGKTLQFTADEIGITRERVRQISLKVSRVLRSYTKPIVEDLLKANNGAFTDDDVLKCFNDESIGTAFLFVIREGDCKYIKFAKKYCSNDFPSNFDQLLSDIAIKYIGDGANFLECIEEIESVLAKEGVPQLDFYDFLSYLISCGYKLYGDFVARNRNAYTLICYDVISRYFPKGIKLEASNDCQDLAELRAIVKERYGDYELPDNNRALVARISPMLVLCDKSTYCVAENIQYTADLLDEIISYVNASSEPFVFYDNLFRQFQGRLLMETTINNYHCLHGVIKLLYPNEFQYERDGMTKIGATRISLDQQITEILLAAGRPMTREEIYQACPYAMGLRLANAVSRDPGIIQWAYNEYNHIDNVKVNLRQKGILEDILRKLTSRNYGYCNERQLLTAVEAELPDFITENNITDSLNLFYILECYFKPEFRFSRPHIVSDPFPTDLLLTNMNVGKYFLGQKEAFSYKEFLDVANRCSWSASMISSVLIELEGEYIRINENEYIFKDKFALDEVQIIDIEKAVLKNMNGEEYVALFAAFANGGYPSIGYEWNEFVLDSIIRHFIPSLKIIEPMMKDRRYKRGILVRNSSEYQTYEDLVVSVMIRDNFEPTPLDLFDDYLRAAGLLLNNIPHEILKSSKISIHDDIVRLV